MKLIPALSLGLIVLSPIVFSQAAFADGWPLLCGVRTVQLPSPGSSSNYVVLKSGANTNEGILFITNVGKCPVFIHGTDVIGRTLDSGNPLKLNPGEYVFQFIPPSESAMIVGATSEECSDYSSLSYDPCAGIL